jgi:hypothetical protein
MLLFEKRVLIGFEGDEDLILITLFLFLRS